MLHSNHYMLAALVGLAAIFSSCSIKEDFDTCNKSQVQLDVRAFGIEQSAFTKAGGGKDPHRIVFKAFDALGAVAYETTQASGQEGFGVLDFELSPGSYTFVAVAHDLSSAALAADEGGSVAASLNSAQEALLPEGDVADCFCDMLNVSLLLTAETQDIDVTAAAYDAEGNLIISHELEDVPMKLNRTTVANGNFFSATGGGSFSFSTDWDTDAEISY